MPLTPTEIRARREALGLTQAAVAQLVGVNSNSVARWEQGSVVCPEPAGRLLRLLAALGTGTDRQAERELRELREHLAEKAGRRPRT